MSANVLFAGCNGLSYPGEEVTDNAQQQEPQGDGLVDILAGGPPPDDIYGMPPDEPGGPGPGG